MLNAQDQHGELPPPGQMAQANFEMIVRKLADDLAFGTDESLFVGSGLEYAQSRPYEPGDPVRQIDWKVTARTGHAYLKQYETLKRISIHLVVDTSGSMSVSSTRLSKHDLAVWISAAVGLVGIRRLSPVAVIAGGERSGEQAAPSMAPGELWRSLDPLRAHGPGEQTEIGERLTRLEPRLGRRCLVVVVSDLHDPHAIGALRHLAQRHDVMAIHLEDPAERGGLRAGFFRGREAETGRHFLGHGRSRWKSDRSEDVRSFEDIGRDLVGAGVSYLHLRTDLPFVTPLRQFLAFRVGGSAGTSGSEGVER